MGQAQIRRGRWGGRCKGEADFGEVITYEGVLGISWRKEKRGEGARDIKPWGDQLIWIRESTKLQNSNN